MRRTALWILLAAVGVLVVAGVTAAASTLSTQSVGLSSEPLTAGDELAPTATPTPKPTRKPKRTATPTPTPTPSVVDDHGGDRHGGSSGHGSDDHGGHGSDD